MKQQFVQPNAPTRLKSGFAVLLVFLVVALGLLAARPDWHAGFHSLNAAVHVHDHAHADDVGHHHHEHESGDSDDHDDAGCAIELFANGQVDSVDVDVCTLLTTRPIPLAPSVSLAWYSTHLGLSPPGRAPPVTV